ncbi:MAG: ribosome-associated translation inhibitor RaiA [Actinomycetota bacterium]|nr:ribosome-associated translation inhibitor RaiA [Nocardioidaceae bacterium]MDQ3592088.1 ribosome-associated translation inhibitor RaiA [Actinomycetota bacterium]
MEVVVSSRHCEVSERFRQHVADKLSRLEKHDDRVARVDVEVTQERNPRQADRAVRIQLTVHSRGPVIRAEAAAEDKMAALDGALLRLQARLRKAADRRRIHRGNHAPVSLAQAAAVAAPGPGSNDGVGAEEGHDPGAPHQVGPLTVIGDGPVVVREKTHAAGPMTLDQALYEMELVGHDFFLFVDKETEQPSVVYRRRGYDYGVIRLEV